MKIFLLFAFLPFLGFGQDSLSDNFSDQNFTQNLSWIGDDSLFIVNPSLQLQLNDSSSGLAYLSTKSKISQEATWRFSVNLGFNPSSSNNLKVYLISDNFDLNKMVNGYFIRVGGSSADKLSLYKQTGSTNLLLTESSSGYLNSSTVELDVLVERDSNSIWKVYADTGSYADPMVLLGTVLDSSFLSSSYFGISCKYTSTRAQLFFFDDLICSGFPLIDVQKPKVDTIIVIYKNKIQITFNERITKMSAENIQNFYMNNGWGSPMVAELNNLDERTLTLTFANDFVFGEEYMLNIKGLSDTAGNLLTDSIQFQFSGQPSKLVSFQILNPKQMRISFNGEVAKNTLVYESNYLFSKYLDIDSITYEFDGSESSSLLYFKEFIPLDENIRIQSFLQEDTYGYEVVWSFWFCRRNWTENDIVFSEVLADPSPVVGLFPNQLPEAEYLEIYNRSGYYLNLWDCHLVINGDEKELPYYNLRPQEYLVLTKDDNILLFSDSIDVLGLDMSNTALLNSGSELEFVTVEGEIINQLNYSINWYQNTGKENGGWALERMDLDIACNGEENWGVNENSQGGSPGFINSIQTHLTDSLAPEVQNMSLVGDSLLQIEWDKALDQSQIMDSSSLRIEPNIKFKSPILYDGKIMEIKFLEKLGTQTTYVLHWDDLPQDCFGNNAIQDSIQFALPELAERFDILVNEVLFNPYSGSSDFVELYNNSDKVFDLSKIRVGNWNAELEIVENVSNVSSESKLFFPKTYLVLSEDVNSVKEFYYTSSFSQFVEVIDLPSLADDEGSFCIINSQYDLLDYMNYEEENHSTLLQNNEGVSLERVSFAIPTSPWYSASSQVGFASPGYENSQSQKTLGNGGIEIIPKLFSPNLDGYDDFINVSLNSQYMGYVVNVSICNSVGNVVRVLEKNELIGTNSFFIWEGNSDFNEPLPSGIYIILVEGIHPDGARISFKETCVLSR